MFRILESHFKKKRPFSSHSDHFSLACMLVYIVFVYIVFVYAALHCFLTCPVIGFVAGVRDLSS